MLLLHGTAHPIPTPSLCRCVQMCIEANFQRLGQGTVRRENAYRIRVRIKDARNWGAVEDR
jgi:hypothetical protein